MHDLSPKIAKRFLKKSNNKVTLNNLIVSLNTLLKLTIKLIMNIESIILLQICFFAV